MIKGVVQKIIKNEQYGLTSFTLKGQDGFFSLGDKPATFQQGDSIQFETFQKGKYTYAQNISPWADGGTTTSGNVASVAASAGNQQWKGRGGGYNRGGSGDAKAKNEFWDAKELRDIERERYNREVTQPRIEIQAARNAAISTANFMWEKDLVPKPKKATEHYDAYLALVNELTSTYVADNAARVPNGKVDSDARSSAQEAVQAVDTGSSGTAVSDNGAWD